MDDAALEYALCLKRTNLLKLYTTWEKSLHGLDYGEWDLSDWSPSNEDIAAARKANIVASVAENEQADWGGQVNVDDSDVDDDLGFEIEEDVGLADALDAVDMADNLRAEGVDYQDYED